MLEARANVVRKLTFIRTRGRTTQDWVAVAPDPTQCLREGRRKDGVALAHSKRCEARGQQLGVIGIDLCRLELGDVATFPKTGLMFALTAQR